MQSKLRAIATAAVLTSTATAVYAEPTPMPISPIACLRKMAMDLTNKAPSDEDFAALAEGKPLGEFADQYIASAAFSQIMFDVFRSAYQPTDLVPDTADKEEPARIGRHLVVNNGDFRDMVSGNYTVDASGNVVPAKDLAAGVLTTQSYLSAYAGADFRNWSGHLIKGLAGIALTPVSEVPADIVDSSPEGLAGQPACAGCHTNPLTGVDNVASFHRCYGNNGLPVAGCTPKETTFLGKSGSTLADLGRILADSVEWRASSIQDFFRIFWGRGIGRNETSFYRKAEQAWLDAGFKPQALVKQIVLSPEYCAR